MTIRVVCSPRAAADIRQIVTFLAEENPVAARNFIVAPAGAQRRLEECPNIGAHGLLPGTRRLVVGNYLVHYRRRGDAVEIFAVRDARRRDSRAPR